MFGPYQTLIDTVKEYSQTVLPEQAKHYDAVEEFPQELLDYFIKEHDIFRLLIADTEDDLGFKAFLEVIRLVSQNFAALGSILLTQGTYAIWPLYRFGTKRQQDAYIEAMVQGDKIGGFALTEVEYGSDIDMLEARAIETDDGWLITAEKQSVSNGPVATVYLVVAKAIKRNGDEALGIFMVERDTPGITVGDPMEKMGIKALPVGTLSLKDVKVPKNAVLGEILAGREQMEAILNKMKIAIATQALGIAQGAHAKGLLYASYERNFGKRLIDVQMTQFKLAELATVITATEALLHRVVDQGSEDTVQVAMIKLMASNVAIQATEEVIQVTGGYGYMRNNDIERFVRDAKVTAIYGGSSTSQKKLIAQPWVSKHTTGE